MAHKAGAFNIGTGAATTTVAVTNVGFQPTAVFLFWSGQVSATDAAGRQLIKRGSGAATGTAARWAVNSSTGDNTPSGDSGSYHTDAACIVSTDADAALDGAADFQSFDADGFTLVIDDQFPTDLRIGYLAFDDPSAKAGNYVSPNATGNHSVTGVGFQPGALILMQRNSANVPPAGANVPSAWGLGFATSASAEVSICGNSDDGAIINATSGGSSARLIQGQSVASSVNFRASLVSMDSDGFTMNVVERVVGVAAYVFYLALAGRSYTVGEGLTQTDTTTDIVVSGLSYAPTGGLIISAGKAETADDATADHDERIIGAFSGTTARAAHGTMNADNVADSVAAAAVEHDAVYVNLDTAGAVEGLMDVKSMDSGGVTFIMDDADPSQAWFGYLLVGNAAAGGGTILPQMMQHYYGGPS